VTRRSVATFTLPGKLDVATAPGVERRLRAVVATSSGDLMVNCRDLKFIDSAGLHMLIEIRRHLAAHGRRLVLTEVGRRLRRLLKVTRLDRTFEIN
jgi:anti-sigma B factor antagonist